MLSYDRPLQSKPSAGTSLYSLHATSHALHPMQSVESVRNAVIGKVVASHERFEIVERRDGLAAAARARRGRRAPWSP